jgi:hypothetical protein
MNYLQSFPALDAMQIDRQSSAGNSNPIEPTGK